MRSTAVPLGLQLFTELFVRLPLQKTSMQCRKRLPDRCSACFCCKRKEPAPSIYYAVSTGERPAHRAQGGPRSLRICLISSFSCLSHPSVPQFAPLF
eukprot:5311647-Amphidinium_carterae.2